MAGKKQFVEFDAMLKRVLSTSKPGEGGELRIVTTIAFEGENVSEEVIRQLVRLQHQGTLRITVECLQGVLPFAEGATA